MGPPDFMKTYGLRGASQKKGQTKIRVRKEFPVFDKLFAKENDVSSSGRKKGLWDDSLDLFDVKAKERKPLKDVNHLLNSDEGSLFSSANDTFDNLCTNGKANSKVADKVPTCSRIEISGPEQVCSHSLISHSSFGSDSCLLYQSMFKHSLEKRIPTQLVKEKKVLSNPWNDSEALVISHSESCSDLEKCSSKVIIDSRKKAEHLSDNLNNAEAVSCSDKALKVANLSTLEENEAEEVYVSEIRTPRSTYTSERSELSTKIDQCPSAGRKCQLRRKILTSTPALASSHNSALKSSVSKHPLRSLVEGTLSPVLKDDLNDDVFVSSPELYGKESVAFQKISRSSSPVSVYESAASSQSRHGSVKEQCSGTSKDDICHISETRRNQIFPNCNQKENNCFLSGRTQENGLLCDLNSCSVDLFASSSNENEITKESGCSPKPKDSIAEKIKAYDEFEVSVVLRNFTKKRRRSLRTCVQYALRNSTKEFKPQVEKQNTRRKLKASGRHSDDNSYRTSRPSFNCSRIRTCSAFRKHEKCRQNEELTSKESFSCNVSSELQMCRSKGQHRGQRMAFIQSNNSMYLGNSKSQQKRVSYGHKKVPTHQSSRNIVCQGLQEDIDNVNIENQSGYIGIFNEDSNIEHNRSRGGKETDGVNEVTEWHSVTCSAKQSPDFATDMKHLSPETVNCDSPRLKSVKSNNCSKSTCSTSLSSDEDLCMSGKDNLQSSVQDIFYTSQLEARNLGSNHSNNPILKSVTETKVSETQSDLCSQTESSFVDEDLYAVCSKSSKAEYSTKNESMPLICNITSMTYSMADLQIQDECGMLPNEFRTGLKSSDSHTSGSLAYSRHQKQTMPLKSNLVLANRQRLSSSRRFGERRSSRKSVLQIGTLLGKNPSKAVLDPKQHVLDLCSQKAPVPIQECLTPSRLKCSKKIGEGAFGEVFMTRPNPNSMEGATVLKIMPIEGDFEVNGEHQKTFAEIVSEIIISKELSGLRADKGSSNWCENFVHVLSSWCVVGSYLPALLDMWDQFNTEKGSENDRPDLFPDTQLYIVLEFGHGGQDLESFVFNNAAQALAIFLQIAYSLAVSEQELEFEHRDLHWGNVLVAVTSAKMMDFRFAGKTYKLKTQGVKATVIDFTLSRLRASDCVVFNNLSEDPALFTSEGDYQFEIYRLMKKVTKNDWEKFSPYTNVLWLHYILDKMETECYYKNIKTKVHQTSLKEIQQLKSSILDNVSATDFVLKREE